MPGRSVLLSSFTAATVLGAFVSATGLGAQTLTVSNSPFAPDDHGVATGSDFIDAVAAFRFSAAGGNVDLTGLTLTVSGNGDWLNDLDPATGVSLWLDDGDGVFDELADTEIHAGPPSTPTVAMTLASPVAIADGSAVDFWVALRVLAAAGSSLPEYFGVEIASTADVQTSPTVVVSFGTPGPVSNALGVIVYFVSTFEPLSGWGNDPITITGSGFTLPLTVSIGGKLATGTPVIDPTGTTVTGLVAPQFVPPEKDRVVPIVISTGLLGPVTAPHTYVQKRDPSLGKCSGSCPCSANSTNPWLPIALLSVIGLMRFGSQRRRRRFRENR